MNTLILELPSNLLQRLKFEAEQCRQPVEAVAITLITNGLPSVSAADTERQQIQQVLRDAGLLWEPTPSLRAFMDELESRLGTPEEREAELQRLRAVKLEPPLSQDIIEMRGALE